MAITRTTRVSEAINSADPWTSVASQAPTTGNLITLAISVQVFGGGTLPTSLTVTANGLTWVAIDHQDETGNHAIWLFRAMGTASSGTVGITQTGGANLKGANITCEDWAGTDTSGTNGSGAIVQSAKTLSTSANPQIITCTLAALGDAVNNAVYMAQSSGSLSTPGGSYTELVDQAGTDYFMQSEWLLPGTTTPSATAATAFQAQVGIAVEIKAASGAASNQLMWVKG